MAVRITRGKIHLRVTLPDRYVPVCPTRFLRLDEIRQSIESRKRRLQMELLTETCVAALYSSHSQPAVPQSGRQPPGIRSNRQQVLPLTLIFPDTPQNLKFKTGCERAMSPTAMIKCAGFSATDKFSLAQFSAASRSLRTVLIGPPRAADFSISQPEHDRNRPEFAELQRHNLLITGDEALVRQGVNPSVRVGNNLQGDLIDAREIQPRTVK